MFVKRLHVNPSPFPFRDVLAVMDRLDLTNPPGTPDRQALVARVRNVCEAGDLPTDGVEAAVDAHLAATNTPKPAEVSGGTPRMGFGWRRPRQMAEQQRWSTPPFWIRTIANIADEGQARLGGPVFGAHDGHG